ncbi:MAG: SDR family oxidoreductase [Clostridia bacterium]|nr:SDR family oxidoreductase [Clostridia bacterium]
MKGDKVTKVIIVTGASKGIGRATATALIKAGHVVYGLSRTEPEGDYGFNYMPLDVTDHAALERTYREIYEKEGAIDCVINNAGWGIAGAVEETDDEAVKKIFDINLCAVEKSCRVALPYLRESKGKIINLSSVAGIMPIAFQAYYTATKAAVYSFSRALAQEVKPYGVRVTSVLPGDTRTGFTAARETTVKNGVYEERVQRSVSRMEKDEQNGASPEKVANVILKAFNKRNPRSAYVVGFSYKLIAFLDRILPKRLVDYILYKLYAK